MTPRVALLEGRAVGDLAEEATLLLLSADEWRDLGYRHGASSRNALCAAFLTEEWVRGGPAPTVEDFRHQMPKQSSTAPRRALEPLVASGRVELQKSESRLGRIFAAGQPKQWRVVDRAGRQTVFDRLAASLGATTPPSRRDATLAVILFAGQDLWERTGLDGPEPRPRILVGSATQPWGPLGAAAQELVAGTVIPDGVTEPGVLPMIARAMSLGDLVAHMQ
jgi:hypothetical protein